MDKTLTQEPVSMESRDQKEFLNILRRRVDAYFTENNIDKHGNFNMVIKTIFMLCLYFVPYTLMITSTVTGFWPVMGMWLLMSFGMAGIGLSIMHDAIHGSYSKNKNLNRTLGFLSNFMGAFHTNWKIQHNTLHHSFTNIDKHDEDIDTPFMRFSPMQKRYKIFKFQAFYALFIYGFLTINWLINADFAAILDYHKRGLLKKNHLTLGQGMTLLIFNKIWYVGLILVLPIMVVDLPWYTILGGFFMMQFICGVILALIFQPAHVLQETEFYESSEIDNVKNEWAIYQLKTTANFARGNKMFSWFIGGLNYQVEHHLFPSICHVHYKEIAKIVKETALEYNLPYHDFKTFSGAVISHFKVLHSLGTGAYDREMQLAQ